MENLESYRQGIGIVLKNRDGDIFIGKRKSSSSIGWQMPQGGIDEGETPEEALWRELFEEVGTRNAIILKEMNDWLTYDIPEPYCSRWWGGKYRGQAQKWFLLDFVGFDCDINLFSSKIPEFSSWRWEVPEAIVSLAVAFKKDIYRKVFKEFF